MHIMGVDPSTKSGVVVLDEQGALVDAKHLLFRKEKGCKRLQLIAQSVRSLLTEYQPGLVVIEGLAHGNKFTKIEMAEVGVLIRMEFWKEGLPWWDIPPTVLKKWTTGKGNAVKADMAKAAEERWGFTSKSDDVVDAYALAQVGLYLLREEHHGLKGVIERSN